MKVPRRIVVLVAVLVVALVSVSTYAVLAASNSLSGKSITAVKVVHAAGSSAVTTSSTTFQTLTSTSITVPAGTKAIILARFSGSAYCNGGGFSNCEVKILIGGTNPTPGTETFGTQPASGSSEGFQAGSMDRARGPLGPGTYSVKVLWHSSTGSATFYIAGWELTVERVAV